MCGVRGRRDHLGPVRNPGPDSESRSGIRVRTQSPGPASGRTLDPKNVSRQNINTEAKKKNELVPRAERNCRRKLSPSDDQTGSATGEALFAHVRSAADATLPSDTMALVSVADGAGNAQNASAYMSGDGAVWCGAHLLQLVARALLDRESYASSVRSIRSYTAYVRTSTERRSSLRKCQENAWRSLRSDEVDSARSLRSSFQVREAWRTLGTSFDAYLHECGGPLKGPGVRVRGFGSS
jgi:hypothetical protein